MKVGVELPRRQDDEHVLGIGVDARHQTSGAPDAGRLESAIEGGIAGHDEMALGGGLFTGRLVGVDHHHRLLRMRQLAGHSRAHPAVAAQDEMLLPRLHGPHHGPRLASPAGDLVDQVFADDPD
jgi:hypothetical protein